MEKKLKFALLFLVLFGIAAIGLLWFYSDRVIVLSPKGMIGEKESYLLLLSTAIMLFIVVPVFLLTFWITWKYRESNREAKYEPDWEHSTLAETIWWGVPFIMICVLGVITWQSCHELDPFKPLQSEVKPLRVQVVALQWKWLFIYPDQGIATVNYVQFPEKTPLNFEISADAPMNSFWIPELGGQIYAMSKMKSKLHLIANGIDTYRGFSSNISGKGFSGMTFIAESTAQGDFDTWVENARQSPPLDYEILAQPSEYVPPATYSLTQEGLLDQIVGMDHASGT
jgi:cytochrome o ubiquinol oxidase subunit 2